MSRPSRSDIRLYVRALRQGWNIPAEMRTEIVNVLADIVTRKEGSTSRERTSAARALVQASRVELDAIRVAHGAVYEDLAKRLEALEGRGDGELAKAPGGN